MMTLAFDKLAEQNPQKSFIHIFPGVVNTGGLSRHTKGLMGYLLKIVDLVAGYFLIQPKDCAEMMLYCGTDPEFAHGSWSLDSDCSPKAVKALVEAREHGMPEKVIEHNERIFERVLSA
jgi:hypothetical protein